MATDPTGRISIIPAMLRGVSWKQPCRVATTANITIATALNAGDTIDGVTLAAGDRVLVKDQSAPAGNGIYLAGATPIRDFDMDQDGTTAVPIEEVLGAVVLVIAGTANAGTLWRATNTTATTLGSTSIAFTQVTISSIAASAVTIADAGGYYTGSNQESADQQIGASIYGVTAHGNMGATETFDAAVGAHTGTLNANCVFTLTALGTGLYSSLVLVLTQDGTGSRTIDFPASVLNGAALEAALDATAGNSTIYVLFSVDGGTNWFGFVAGGGGSSLTIKDEGTPLATAATSIDFVGAGVTASGATAAKTVTISGAPTGAAGGDLAGTYPNPTITAAAIMNAGHWEVVMTDGITDPPEPVWTDEGSEWVYSWIPG